RLGGDTDRDLRAVASAKVGLWFGVLGLLTGSLWARFTWGAWWVDDPQLNGAFVTVLVYAGYLILRASIQEPLLRARLSGVYNLFGFCLLVVLLMVLPRFTESLHPGKGGNPAFSSYDLDSALRLVFYPAVLGWMVLGTWMYSAALKAERLRHRLSEARLTKASMPLGMLLMTPASTSGWEAWFLSSGKLNVVVGVAVIIFSGLVLWGWRMRRELKSLSEDLERLKTN
ncbi:cytochrome c biogenesis protein, partial [Flavobacteriales bacterium]|nr:cytochrome c biogenesis protein [Flavobacteriales bacterium]